MWLNGDTIRSIHNNYIHVYINQNIYLENTKN